MHARSLMVMTVISVCLTGVVVAQDDVLPLSNWSTAPYWNPAVQPRGESEPVAGMVAHAQGMQAKIEALPSSPLPFVAIAPCRIVDTRQLISDGFHQPNFADDEARTFPFPSSTDCPGLPASAGAYSLNIQFRPMTQLSFLTAYPTGTTMPLVSTLTASSAAWVQNAAVVPAGTGGAVDVYCQYAGRVVIDVNGYYGPQSVVTSLNAKIGDVTLAQGSNVTITPSGNTLTIAAAVGPGGSLPVGTNGQTLYHSGASWVAASNLYNTGTDVGIVGWLQVAGPLTAGAGFFVDAATNGTGVDGRANVGSNAWGVYGSSGEGIGVMGRSGAATGFAGRFENLSTGNAIGASVNGVEVMDVDGAGVHAGPGMTPTPLAHGVFSGADGHRLSGSSNIDCTWNATWSWYECTITGEYFYYTSYTAVVTPLDLAVPRVGSGAGLLVITFYSNPADGNSKIKLGNGFSVAVFKQ